MRRNTLMIATALGVVAAASWMTPAKAACTLCKEATDVAAQTGWLPPGIKESIDYRTNNLRVDETVSYVGDRTEVYVPTRPGIYVSPVSDGYWATVRTVDYVGNRIGATELPGMDVPAPRVPRTNG